MAFIENCSTSKLVKASPEKSQILSCDTVVVHERYLVAIQSVLIFYHLRLCVRSYVCSLGVRDMYAFLIFLVLPVCPLLSSCFVVWLAQ